MRLVSPHQLYEGEPAYKRRKFNSPLVEISELLAESKRNAAATAAVAAAASNLDGKRPVGSGGSGHGLPLSVEIEEMDSGADAAVSPQR